MIWHSAERRESEGSTQSGERGVVLTTLVRSARRCSIILAVWCGLRDSAGMIHKDSGLVSSRSPNSLDWLLLFASHLFLFFFFPVLSLPSSSLWPAVLGLSCSPSGWNVSPARCWEDLLGSYRLISPPHTLSFFSRRHSLAFQLT